MDEFIRLLIKHLKTDIRNPWAWGSLVLSGAWLIAAGSIASLLCPIQRMARCAMGEIYGLD
jgi:hypothetical protein